MIINNLFNFIMEIVKMLVVIIPVLIAVAYLTLAESKFLGYSQNSKGPNMVGMYGLLQPLADGAKLFMKETMVPNHVSLVIYMFSPVLALILGLMVWVILPLGKQQFIVDFYLGLLMVLAFGSIGVYAMLMSGWGSNSKYAFLGALSATAQMISYEVSLGLILMTMMILSSSFDFNMINNSQSSFNFFILALLPAGFMYLISGMAETNSAPFDLTEGESELVSGFNIEYPGMTFALFFLAEYAHMMFTGFMFSVLFVGGWSWYMSLNMVLGLKASFFIMFFVWVSTSFPSFSYDQLMHLMWKSFLPCSLFFMVLVFSLIWFL